MSKVKVKVQLTEKALEEFKAIQNHDNFLISEWGTRYLKKLVGLSAENWLEVRRRWEKGVFKANDLIPFDIRGKVQAGPAPRAVVVFITHFQLRNDQSQIWFDPILGGWHLDQVLER